MVDPEARHLRSFLAAAEELHFGRAAARLHLTQQALSGHIRQLEVALSTVLFERTTRRVSLTPAGRALLDPAQRVLGELAGAVAAVRAADIAAVANLRVGVFGFAAYWLLPQITRRLAEQNPLLTVTQRETPDRTAVLLGEVDVALGTPLDLPVGLAASPVHQEHVVVAVPADHHLANRDAVDLRDLLREPVAGPVAGVAPEWDRLIAQAARSVGAQLQPAPATFGNLATALGVAAEQRYPALLTSEARRWPLDGVRLLDVHPNVPWTTAVLHLDATTNSAVLAFLEAAIATAAAEPPADPARK